MTALQKQNLQRDKIKARKKANLEEYNLKREARKKLRKKKATIQRGKLDKNLYDSAPVSTPLVKVSQSSSVSTPQNNNYSDQVKAKRNKMLSISEQKYNDTKGRYNQWLDAGKKRSAEKRKENKKRMQSGPVYKTRY